MQKFSHWTPRYVVNRTRWWFFERRNPEKPWLTPDAISALSTLLLPTDVGVEWGSGRSTCWFGRRLKHLTSVEDNTQWYERVQSMIREKNLTNVDYRLCSKPKEPNEASSDYVRICDNFADQSLGFALVDGSAREFCAQAVLNKLMPGGLLVIDNCNWFLDHPTHSPASRTGVGSLNEKWAQVASALDGWRFIWTTSGVTDTGIWIKPANAL